jgi:amino acid adenylation domain-containing protein
MTVTHHLPGRNPAGHGGASAQPPAVADVVDLFHHQVDTNPESIAVDDGTRRYNYRELQGLVTDLAERIRLAGVDSGSAVAACLPRSIEGIVSLLAVLEADGVYVPLDPAWPVSRLKTMCDSAGVAAVIGAPELDDHLPGALIEVRFPSRTETGQARIPRAGWSTPDPEAGAYIIFTSGTTGTPKGVQISRANLAAFLAWVRTAFSPDELAMTATSISFTFDPHLIEVLGPLCVGGCVRVIPHAFALADVEPGVTMIATTPSVAGELLRKDWLPPTLRTLVVGGEVLSPALAEQLLDQTHLRRLVNAYGPTEATVAVSSFDVTLPACGPIPLGRPITRSGIVVVDDELEPVPDGTIGELVVTGAQVGNGYAADPELSATKFITLAGPAGPVRAYRTGDLGRRRADGMLEYCGRVDRQVKVRGFRVEPGEIEAALGRLPQVSQAAVRAVGSGSDAILVAFVVPAGPFDPRQARRRLRETLAEYLVPSRFVTVEALPLTAQGKLDERALDALSARTDVEEETGVNGSSATPARRGTTTRTSTEERVAALAREVLGITGAISADQDFLDDLGGTSLSMIGLLSAMENEFSCRLPVRRALENTTIAGLAALVSERTADVSDPAGTGQWDGNRAPLFLINPYVGSVLRQRRLNAYLPDGCQVIPIDVHDAGSDFEAAGLSIVDLAEQALLQIRAVKPQGPYWLGGHSAGGLVALEAAQRLLATGEEVGGLLLIDTPATRSRLDYLWGEVIMNWPEFRAGRGRDRRSTLRSLIRSRLSIHRRPKPINGTGLAEGIERATRRTNIATKRYRPSAYPGPVTLLWTGQGLRMARGRIALGWDRLVHGPFRAYRIEGDHNTIFDQPYVPGLGAEIGRFLAGSTLNPGDAPITLADARLPEPAGRR